MSEEIEAAERAYEEIAAQGQRRAFWGALCERYPEVNPELLQKTLVTHFHDDLAHLTADKAIEKIGELAGRYTAQGGEAVVMHGGAVDGHIADRGVPKTTDDEEIPPSLGALNRQRWAARRKASQLPVADEEFNSLGTLSKVRNQRRREAAKAMTR
jgi:hypothetical protein